MQKNIRHVFSMYCFVLALFAGSHAQYVPFYPIEVYFSPLGFTNTLPGCDPNLYAGFSAVKVILEKDLPSTKTISNTIGFIGNFEYYNGYTKARSYFPLMMNPVLRSHFFLTDVFTLGLEINGTYEQFPDFDVLGNTTAYNNYRLRLRPFCYVIPTPNTILKFMTLAGGCRNSSTAGKDYDFFKYEVTAIYLAPYNTRLFFVPYAYNDSYYNLQARSADGTSNSKNPNLKELGYGCVLGARHGSFKYGYSEAAFEYERNADIIYGANNYHKFKITSRWENQYFTQRWGFLLMGDVIRYISGNDIYGLPDPSAVNAKLGQTEIMGDAMLVLNINRNLSFRPEYTIVFKDYTNGYQYKKHRFVLNLHIWW